MIWSDWYDSIVLRTLVLRIVCSIWNFSVVPMKFTCTLEIHVALSCASCNMNFQSGNKFHIALTKMPYKMMFSTVLAFCPIYIMSAAILDLKHFSCMVQFPGFRQGDEHLLEAREKPTMCLQWKSIHLWIKLIEIDTNDTHSMKFSQLKQHYQLVCSQFTVWELIH